MKSEWKKGQLVLTQRPPRMTTQIPGAPISGEDGVSGDNLSRDFRL